jgi:hypothetical protein
MNFRGSKDPLFLFPNIFSDLCLLPWCDIIEEKGVIMGHLIQEPQLIISLVIVMVTILGSTIPLYIHTSSQLNAIQQEMKDFHGRLCAIEERNKGK